MNNTHYPRIPVSLTRLEYQKALGAAIYYVSSGRNPKRLPPPTEERKKVKIKLNEYEEECLEYLVTQIEVFPSKNDIFLFCFQFVAEETERWPHFLNIRVP